MTEKHWNFRRTVLSSGRITLFEQSKNSAKAERVAALGPAWLGAIPPGIGVEMRPGYLFRHEAPEEQCGVNRSRHGVARGVCQIGDVALQVPVIGIP